MDQYKKLLNAVNTGSTNQNSRQSSLPTRQTAKPYVYVSGVCWTFVNVSF